MEKINRKIIGIIGPSGSGQSTLAELLRRNLPCTSICSFVDVKDVKIMEKEIEDTMSLITTIVIDDVRMPEELAWLKKQGAIVIVLMPSLEKKPDKIPETEKLAWEIIEEQRFLLSDRFITQFAAVFFCSPAPDGKNFLVMVEKIKKEIMKNVSKM